MNECRCPEREDKTTTIKNCLTVCPLYVGDSARRLAGVKDGTSGVTDAPAVVPGLPEIPTNVKLRTSDLQPATPSAKVLEVIRENGPGPWPADWAKWDNVQEAHRELFREYRDSIEEYPESAFSGRGIVICAGAKHLPHRGLPNGGYMPCVWVLVSKLRMMGCNLPIQLWHIGTPEMDPHISKMLAEYGVECIDARDVEEQVGIRILAGWEMKVFATKWSSFEEVLFLDADNAPINRDVGLLFEGEEYKRTGAVFWPDYDHWVLHENIWRIFGILSPGREPALESGQYLINKKKCWKELCLSLKYAEHSDYVFKHVYGDKEVFHLAWRQLGSEYSIPKRGPGWEGDKAGGFCIVQHDFDGTQIFLHRCQDKWKYGGGNRTGSMTDETLHHQFADQFTALWNGKLWDNPSPNQMEVKAMASLAGEYTYERHAKGDFSGGSRKIELLADGSVGEGRDRCEVRWACHLINYRGKNQLVVSLCSDIELTALFTISESGLIGEWIEHERCACSLKRIGDVTVLPVEDAVREVLGVLLKRGYPDKYGRLQELIKVELKRISDGDHA